MKWVVLIGLTGAMLAAGCGGKLATEVEADLVAFDLRSADSLLVFKNNGAIQCQHDGLSLAQTEQQLEGQGIDVLGSECGQFTGITELKSCGNVKLKINVHEISAAALPRAEQLGFAPLEAFTMDSALDIQWLDGCKGSTGVNMPVRETAYVM